MTTARRYQNPIRPRRTPTLLFPLDSLPDFWPVGESWGVVVPVKRLELAKTRLSSYGDKVREELALAFAADVVLAARQVATVLVVTDDSLAAAVLGGLGATIASDDPDAGLNPALAHGAELLRGADSSLGIATLSADLPALRADELRAALAQVPISGRAFVPDREGTGTTLLAAAAGTDLLPAYGTSSRDRHASSGAIELRAGPGLRADVDTPDDLLDALVLGAGPHTRSAVEAIGVQVGQATVSSWDASAGGSAYRDDGTSLSLSAESLGRSAFRFARVGQRVRVVLLDDVVVRVGLP